jgi:hypothetical protein
MDTDFIEKYAAVIEEWRHAGGVQLRLPESNFFNSSFRFLGLDSEQLRGSINDAMKLAVPYYERNVSRAPSPIDHKTIEEVALEVVLNIITVRSEWKRGSWIFRWTPLFKASELGQDIARDQILFHCQKKYGPNYVRPAASLMGMTVDEFATWEKKRRKFWYQW